MAGEASRGAPCHGAAWRGAAQHGRHGVAKLGRATHGKEFCWGAARHHAAGPGVSWPGMASQHKELFMESKTKGLVVKRVDKTGFTRVTISIPKQLRERMKSCPQVNWSASAAEHFEAIVNELTQGDVQ